MPLTIADVDLTDLDTFVQGVPHDQFDALRREAPVYFHPETEGAGFWCITRADDLATISHDWERNSSEWGITLHELPEAQLEQQRMMMLQMDPPRHTKLRLLVNKGFTPRMIGRLHDSVREIARDIVDGIAERGECDFVVDVAAELPLQVIAEMMGVPKEDREKLFDWSNRMIGSEDPEYAVSEEDAMAAATEMFLYANDLAAKKRAEPGRRHHQRAAAGRGRGRDALRDGVRPLLRAPGGRRQRDDPQPDLARDARTAREPRPARQAAGGTRSCSPVRSTRCCATHRR